jgi:anaerobic magnesium-protoporphyrin IX monomethyl ester cyclase
MSRFWGPEWVVNQIEDLVEKHGVKVFKLIDEMFVLKSEHYLDIADRLAEKGLGDEINIWAYARVDTTKPKHLERLRKGGVKWLCYGFESGNNDILKQAHKGNFTRQDIIDISNKVRDNGINIIANYMFGFEEDKLDTMQETLDMAIEQNCEFANFYSACAWPGSKLYDRVIEKGVRTPEKWGDYAQHAYGFIPLPTNHLSPSEVLEFRDKAFDMYFTNPKYLNMIKNKFGLKARQHIEDMTKIKLKRKILE